MKFELTYQNGEEVRENDKVLTYSKRPGIVEAILKPGTKLAYDYYVEDEGGFILQFEDGQVEVWMTAKEKIELVARG